MQMGYRCRGCSKYENMEYHDWQCPHCGHNNLQMKICASIQIEAELPEDEVRSINKLDYKQQKYAIQQIRKIISNAILNEMDFEEEHIKKIDVSYEDSFYD